MNPSSTFPVETFSRVEQLQSDASAVDGGGVTVEPVPSFRGATRVWRVRQKAAGSAGWYVKSLESEQAFDRYIESARALRKAAALSDSLHPLEIVAQDRDRLLLATRAVDGVIASGYVVNGCRYDKFYAWPGTDLGRAGRLAGEALNTVWQTDVEAAPAIFEDYRPYACAERTQAKFNRLVGVQPDFGKRFGAAVSEITAALGGLADEPVLMIGDVDLANMLVTDGKVLFFDLDDVGLGDSRRDVACLLYRLAMIKRNWKYSARRLSRLRRSFLDSVTFACAESEIGLYQVEFVLDALWSACRHRDDDSLPVHGMAASVLERDLQTLLAGGWVA